MQLMQRGDHSGRDPRDIFCEPAKPSSLKTFCSGWWLLSVIKWMKEYTACTVSVGYIIEANYSLIMYNTSVQSWWNQCIQLNPTLKSAWLWLRRRERVVHGSQGWWFMCANEWMSRKKHIKQIKALYKCSHLPFKSTEVRTPLTMMCTFNSNLKE